MQHTTNFYDNYAAEYAELVIAREKDPTNRIAYQVFDLSQPLPMYEQRFDLIVSHFVMNDVPDYRGFLNTLGSVARCPPDFLDE